MNGDLGRLVHAYLLLVGGGLLLEGAVLLLAAGTHLPLPFALDDRHNVLHVIWGIVILAGVTIWRDPRQLATLALVFGIFYTALAIAGVVVTNPFDLALGPGENIFHFTVGLAALAVAAVHQVRLRKVLTRADASGR